MEVSKAGIGFEKFVRNVLNEWERQGFEIDWQEWNDALFSVKDLEWRKTNWYYGPED